MTPVKTALFVNIECILLLVPLRVHTLTFSSKVPTLHYIHAKHQTETSKLSLGALIYRKCNIVRNEICLGRFRSYLLEHCHSFVYIVLLYLRQDALAYVTLELALCAT